MTKLYKSALILNLIILFITACSLQAGQGEQIPPKTAIYKEVLGKSLNDKVVADFIATNHCTSAAQFKLCNQVGMALVIGPDQTVETIYLCLNDVRDFAPYKGELPFGLKFYDTMGAVEYRLKKQGVGNVGLPDSGSTPDHVHYWANYQQVGMTIIYNTPSAEDEDGTIYEILVSQ